MNAALRFPRMETRGVAVALLGTGVVGAALLRLLATPAASDVHLVGVADSRRQLCGVRGLVPAHARDALARTGAARDDALLCRALDASGVAERVIVDATASEQVAASHARWLASGYHVVSANKAAAGGGLSAWRALQRAIALGRTRYGDAATVGAGLPALATVRRLRACGDRLVALDGVFSGSLSWLFNRFDGSRPFSALVREARERGLTEPDPRHDLAGADVARKLLILARAAGWPLDVDDVEVEGLVPPALQAGGVPTFLDRLSEMDDALEDWRRYAEARGNVLRFLARLDDGGAARVGLAEVAATHPAARLVGADNLFSLTTERYRTSPLVIQGPGAGPDVTAQALLGDLLAIGQGSGFA